MTPTKTNELKQFTSRPIWYIARGVVMMLVGSSISVLCLIAPNVYMLGSSFSWIPAVGIVMILVGIFRCIDAYATETAQGFLINMQGGVLDIVTGFLVLFSITGQSENLHLLVAGYMITQGIYRNIRLSVAKAHNPIYSAITGVISIILGIFIWTDWPTTAIWFIALSLSIDISFRGWSLIILATSHKKTA